MLYAIAMGQIIKRFSGLANSNMVYKILWESGWLPWQPNLGQKIALISSLQEIGKFIACTVYSSPGDDDSDVEPDSNSSNGIYIIIFIFISP